MGRLSYKQLFSLQYSRSNNEKRREYLRNVNGFCLSDINLSKFALEVKTRSLATTETRGQDHQLPRGVLPLVDGSNTRRV